MNRNKKAHINNFILNTKIKNTLHVQRTTYYLQVLFPSSFAPSSAPNAAKKKIKVVIINPLKVKKNYTLMPRSYYKLYKHTAFKNSCTLVYRLLLYNTAGT